MFQTCAKTWKKDLYRIIPTFLFIKFTKKYLLTQAEYNIKSTISFSLSSTSLSLSYESISGTFVSAFCPFSLLVLVFCLQFLFFIVLHVVVVFMIFWVMYSKRVCKFFNFSSFIFKLSVFRICHLLKENSESSILV